MSDELQRFSNLSITGASRMVTTRSATRAQQQRSSGRSQGSGSSRSGASASRASHRTQYGEGSEEEGSESGHGFEEEEESEDDDESMPDNIIRSASTRLVYDLTSMDAVAAERARLGLEERTMSMRVCSDHKSYFAFQINDSATVRIAADGATRRPACSCSANRSNIACEHIFWLGDQLAKAVNHEPPAPLSMSRDGATVSNATLGGLVTHAGGFQTVADSRRWIISQDPVGDSTRDKAEIMDILSTLEPTNSMLPREFRRMHSGARSSLIYHDLCKIITEHALRDRSLFLQLQSKVTAKFRNESFMAKLKTAVKTTFKALRTYVANGPSDTELAYDVVTCADELERIVGEIKEFIKRVSGPAGGPNAARAAQEAVYHLGMILDNVINWNKNAYEDLHWRRSPVPNETIVDVNLFQRLIGHADPQGPRFVLSVLKDIPETVIRVHKSAYGAIIERLEAEGAPPRYVNKLGDLTGNNR